MTKLTNEELHKAFQIWLRTYHGRKDEELAYIAKKFMNDPKFRREQGWSQRANR